MRVRDCSAKENPVTADPTQLGVIVMSSMLMSMIPELSSTEGLKMAMQGYFGDNFEVISNAQLLGKERPFCITCTSHPDKATYHKQKYVFENVIRCSALLDHDYTTMVRYTITGASDEDKKKVHGETQCISGLIQLMAKLGEEAVIEEKFFSRAIIYGCVRHTDREVVRPYKLMHDFIGKDSTVIRPDVWIHPGVYMQRVKNLLENPHLSTFNP